MIGYVKKWLYRGRLTSLKRQNLMRCIDLGAIVLLCVSILAVSAVCWALFNQPILAISTELVTCILVILYLRPIAKAPAK